MNTKGLVLRARDTAENDRALTILTPESGVVSAFANGSKRLKSNQLAAAQALCYGEFSLYRRRDTYSVDDARAISVFFGLREDITALALAQYFCELAAALAPAETESAEILNLMVFALTCLEKKRRPQDLLKPAVELRILSLAGYAPDLMSCRVCGGDTIPGDCVRLDMSGGNFVCEKCKGDGEQIGLGVFNAMRHICRCPLKKLFSFALPAPSLAALGKVCEDYLRAQVPRRWDALGFYHELKDEG